MGSKPDADLVDQFLDTFSALARFTATRAIPKLSESQRADLLAQLDSMTHDMNSVESLQPKMRAFLMTLGGIADNLVVRLISNDLQAQFVERMLQLHPRPGLKPELLRELVSDMRLGVESGDGEAVASALDVHFLSMRALVAQALASD